MSKKVPHLHHCASPSSVYYIGAAAETLLLLSSWTVVLWDALGWGPRVVLDLAKNSLVSHQCFFPSLSRLSSFVTRQLSVSSRWLRCRYQRRYYCGAVLGYFRHVNGYEACERVILPVTWWQMPK